ncbi:MAG: hypothetical protein ABEJ31_06020 [Haloarculaceae archaeon]
MADTTTTSPAGAARSAVRSGWNTLHTVYYANTVFWRALKSGGLILFGFFLWAGSNVLLSYQPGWTVLHYAMAYGFLLIGYGPFHHVVVIPLSIRWRRAGGLRTRVGRHLPNAGLAVFLAAVLVVGTFPAGPVTADFQSGSHGGVSDVDPTLHCVQYDDGGATRVRCRLNDTAGVSRVAVRSGQAQLAADDAPPFALTFDAADVQETAGQRRFVVEVYGADGTVARRYTRRLSMLDEGPSTPAA